MTKVAKLVALLAIPALLVAGANPSLAGGGGGGGGGGAGGGAGGGDYCHSLLVFTCR